MQFLVYIVVVLVALSSILLELDWLTKPKLESKAAMQTASTAVPAAKPKVDGPNAELTPVYPKPDAPQPAVDAQARAPAAPDSAAKTEPAAPADATAKTEVAKTEATKAEPPQTTTIETSGAVTPAEAATQSVVSSATFTSNVTQTAAKNQCDVQGCASAYKSFRASDCTYQPFEGPRQVCVKPPEAKQRVASEPREPNREGESREIVRRPPYPQRAYIEDDDFDEPDRVIVIRRPGPRW